MLPEADYINNFLASGHPGILGFDLAFRTRVYAEKTASKMDVGRSCGSQNSPRLSVVRKDFSQRIWNTKRDLLWRSFVMVICLVCQNSAMSIHCCSIWDIDPHPASQPKKSSDYIN